jgi:hypothetical protein
MKCLLCNAPIEDAANNSKGEQAGGNVDTAANSEIPQTPANRDTQEDEDEEDTVVGADMSSPVKLENAATDETLATADAPAKAGEGTSPSSADAS